MTVIPSTTAGTCPLCEGDVPAKGYHVCSGVQVIARSHLQQVPSSLDNEILAELKAIKELLEKIYMEI